MRRSDPLFAMNPTAPELTWSQSRPALGVCWLSIAVEATVKPLACGAEQDACWASEHDRQRDQKDHYQGDGELPEVFDWFAVPWWLTWRHQRLCLNRARRCSSSPLGIWGCGASSAEARCSSSS